MKSVSGTGLLLAVQITLLGTNVLAESASNEIELLYTSDWLSNRDGGMQRDTRYLTNVDVIGDFDLGSILGSGRSRLVVHGSYNNGKTFSGDVVGDVQSVSNIEADEATRLYQLYYEHTGPDESWSLLFGLWDLNSGIDVIEPAGLFLHSSHGIGADFGLSGANGPSIFPVTSLSVRGRYQPNDKWSFQVAILDGVPGDPEKSHRTDIDLSRSQGALVVGEAAYAVSDAWVAKAGVWHYTSESQGVDQEGNEDHEQGVYASLAGELLAPGKSGAGSLQGFLRYGFASDAAPVVSSYLGAGLVYEGVAASRPHDSLGIAVARAFASDRVGDQSANAETAVEVSYSAQLTPWLRLQPNMQYVNNPGFDKALDDALVIGVRIELSHLLEF